TAAAVVDKGEGSEEKYICGYIVSEIEEASAEVRKYLMEHLPHHMVPAKIIQLKELPTTVNGKIDRKALRRLEEEREYIAPRNEMERKIAQIWREQLKVDRVGIDESFFQLGGNSISVFNFILCLEAYDIKIKASDLFQYPTVRDLSRFIMGDLNINNSSPSNSINKIEEIKIKNSNLLGQMEPFNDIFYKNCFYNSLFPVLKYFNLSIMPVLINDIIVYDFHREKRDVISYLPTQSIEEVIRDMNIEVGFMTDSDDIVKDIIKALSSHKPVIIWIDCYYSPIRHDEYKKKHLPHTLLIYDYDEAERVFYTIEHTNQYSFNYKKRTISYTAAAKGFYGYQRYYNSEGFNAYYDFSYGGKVNFMLNAVDQSHIRNTFKSNFDKNKEKIYSGLDGIKEFREYFLSICNSEATLFTNIDETIEKINSVINAKKVEEYRNRILFDDLKGPLRLMETILEQWTLIRMILLKSNYHKNYDKTQLDLCSRQFNQIYSLEYIYNDLLETTFKGIFFP
ncbi:phosphopantetheine-binding protein, partial [Alkaliphilus peptidifermentans]